jgi:hypothetical protein
LELRGGPCVVERAIRSESTIRAICTLADRSILCLRHNHRRALLCRRTTGAIVFSEAWPVNNAQTLQVLCGRRPLPTLHFLDDPSAAKSVASVSGLVLHASVDFLRLKDLLTVGNSDMHALVDRVWVLTLKSRRPKKTRRASVSGVTDRPITNISLPRGGSKITPYGRRLDARSLRRDSQAWAAFWRTIRRTPSWSSGGKSKRYKGFLLRRLPLMGVPDTPSTKQISRERSPGEPLHTPPTACHSNGRPAFGKRQWRLSPIPRTVLERAYQLRGHPR